MGMRCPDCGTEVVEELDYCFGCFRHLAARPTEKPSSAEAKSSRLRGRRARKESTEEATETGFIPDDELVEAAPPQKFMTWRPGSIPKGHLTFGTTAQDSEWRRTTRTEDH